jgi:hypothetical protein
MPIPAPIFKTPPYDDMDIILNFARVIANDCGLSLSGNLLSDDQPYTFTMLQLAFRKLCNRLANQSIESFPEEILCLELPSQNPDSFLDPAVQCYLGYNGYWDGASLYPYVYLPQDMEIPIKVWQRVSDQKAQFYLVTPAQDGIPTTPKGGLLQCWEWRGDAIWFPGSSQKLDLRIRYKRILPDPTPDMVINNMNPAIPILRCAVALAYMVVEIFAAGRGSTILPAFSDEKEDAIKQIVNTTTRKNQRKNYRRIPYSRRGRFR